MKTSQRREIELTVVFNLEEARNLLAYLRKDESVPWGISDGLKVCSSLTSELEKFVRGS